MTLFDVVILSAAKDLLQPYHRASILPHSVIPTGTDHREGDDLWSGGTLCFHPQYTRPKDWAWSSFRHYLTGEEGTVEIESHRTAKKREALGLFPTVQLPGSTQTPPFASR